MSDESSARAETVAEADSAPLSPAPTTSGTRGFLFSDLRGYTAFVERAGDQAAAELLSIYRALVREVIAAHDGAEIKTEGDSVYVVFPNASAAVEAGLEIIAAAAEQSTSERPIRVGVGIHAGETVATTEGLVGGAVNIAARVCAKAQPGELLVTDTVRALTRTFLPYRYTSLGTQQLKGITGGIPLYRVEVTPSTRSARLRRQLSARRGRVALVAGLVVVLVAVGAGVYAANRAPDCLTLPASTKDVVAKIDPSRNCVVATYEVGRRPGPIVAAEGVIWVANVDDWTISQVGLGTGTVRTIGSGGAPVALAPGPTGDIYVLIRDDKTFSTTFNGRDRVVWVSGPRAEILEIRLLPAFLAATGNEQFLTSGYWGIAFYGGHAWISDQSGPDVIRMTLLGRGAGVIGGYVVAHTSTEKGSPGTGPIAAGSGAVWAASPHDAEIYRVEGITQQAAGLSLDDHGGSLAIDTSPSSVWLARQDGFVTRYDQSGASIASFEVGGAISDLAVGETRVWVARPQTRSVTALDASTGNVVSTVQVGGQPDGVTMASDGSVWVTIHAP